MHKVISVRCRIQCTPQQCPNLVHPAALDLNRHYRWTSEFAVDRILIHCLSVFPLLTGRAQKNSLQPQHEFTEKPVILPRSSPRSFVISTTLPRYGTIASALKNMQPTADYTSRVFHQANLWTIKTKHWPCRRSWSSKRSTSASREFRVWRAKSSQRS